MKARDNPFSVERIHAIRYRPLHTTFPEILARLHELNYRAGIIGPEGSGKTTLLEDLRQDLESQGWRTKLIFVNDNLPLTSAQCRRFLCELAREELVLLDGADLIRRHCWSLLKRTTITRAAGLVVTSHRPGLLPTLIDCRTTPALLRDLVQELQPHGRPVPPDFLDSLYKRHAGNLRACLRDLYDLYTQGA
jgi:hypothetical protein